MLGGQHCWGFAFWAPGFCVWLPSHFTRARFSSSGAVTVRSMPAGHVNAKLPCLFAPFPGENPRLLQTQRDSSLSSCLQTANQEQCLTVRNNYLASFALSTFQIQKGDKATVPVAQARSPSRRASSTAGSSLIPAETHGGARLGGMRGAGGAISQRVPHLSSFFPNPFLSGGWFCLQMPP